MSQAAAPSPAEGPVSEATVPGPGSLPPLVTRPAPISRPGNRTMAGSQGTWCLCRMVEIVAFTLTRGKQGENWNKEAMGKHFQKRFRKCVGIPQCPGRLQRRKRLQRGRLRTALPRASDPEAVGQAALRVTFQAPCAARPFSSTAAVIRCLFY